MWEMTIGIECHVQLATKTKLFSPADNDSRNAEPNSKVHPVDYALPGMLPVLNEEAVRLAVRAGKALNSQIANISRFDRKQYFYPDLPKGYQTTQMYQPIIIGGKVDAPLDDGSTLSVRLHHAHMEEDAGKLTHTGSYSLVDLNRAGTPLIEIVSEPDIHSPAEARAYATELYNLMTFAGVTHGDLYHGNMRFDVNLSVAKVGSDQLGTRTETKNLNSFRSIERAAQYEFDRQVALLEAGEKVTQETRGWDDDTGKTISQRSKEDAQDYRYMPDPDIPPLVLSQQDIAMMQDGMPVMPGEYRQNWLSLDLDKSVINTVLSHPSVAETAESVRAVYGNEAAKRVFNWFASAGEFDRNAVESGTVGPRRLGELAQMVGENKLSSTGAKEVFFALFEEQNLSKTVAEIAESMQLIQISDESAIIAVVEQVLASESSQKAVEDIRAGNDKAIGFLVGQVMKQSKGRANPALAQKLIRERL